MASLIGPSLVGIIYLAVSVVLLVDRKSVV